MSVPAAQALARIPAFPPVAARVLGLLAREEVAVKELEALIGRDPALASEVLGRANSSLYSLGSRIRTVRHAIAILGLANLKSAVSAAAMSRYLKALTILDSLRAWWQHSLATAVIAQNLGPPHGIDGGRAYLAGLLHDLGPMALLVAYTADYERLLSTLAEDPEADNLDRVLAMEQYVLGIDQRSAALYLAAKWRLPEEVIEVLGASGPPADAVALPLLVQTASRIADALGWSSTKRKLQLSFDELVPALPEVLQASVAERRDTLAEAVLRELAADHTHHNDTEMPAGPEAEFQEPVEAPESTPRYARHRQQPLLVCAALAAALLLAAAATVLLGR